MVAGHQIAQIAPLVLTVVVESMFEIKRPKSLSIRQHASDNFTQHIKQNTCNNTTEHTPDRVEHRSGSLERKKRSSHISQAHKRTKAQHKILRLRHLPTESTYLMYTIRSPQQASASLIPPSDFVARPRNATITLFSDDSTRTRRDFLSVLHGSTNEGAAIELRA